MPKMEPASITQKISLSQIIDTGNIRTKEKYGPNAKGEYPDDIIELAMSIKSVGQLQAVILKLHGEADKIKQYELIAGFRRRAAFQYLCSIGEDYNLINANIVTGEKLIIQLVENVQREDLTAPEREAAIFKLLESGLKQTEIAAQLSKPKAFVSVNISAYKMRQAAQKNKIDLSGVETSTLSELLSVPDEKLADILKELVRLGGTRAAASILAAPFKKGKQATPQPEPPAPVPSNNTEQEPAGEEIDPLKNEDTEPEPQPARPASPEPPPEVKTPEPKQPEKEKTKAAPEPRIEADHGIVDVNVILTVIYDYMEDLKKNLEKTNSIVWTNQLKAAKEILALILKRLDDA